MIHRLRRWLWARSAQRKALAPYTPDFSTVALQDSLGVAETTACLSWFDAADRPKFFRNSTEQQEWFASYQRLHPMWFRHCLDRVEREQTEAYSRYGLVGPPLAPAYPWAGSEETPGRDIQYRKKPHRFSFLPRMALAASVDDRFATHLLSLLEDWMAFAGGPRGEVAYDSNLAVIQRLLACHWGLLLLSAGTPTTAADCRLVLLRIVGADVRFLSGRLGESFANNHLLADRFAGWYLSRFWPEFAGETIDPVAAEAEWEAELLAQTLGDGGSVEPSVHYHEFACDMAIAHALLSRCNAWAVSRVLEDRLRKMLRLQVSLAGPHLIAYPLGDCIEDNFFPLALHEGLGPGIHRAVLRALYEPTLPVGAPMGHDVEAAFWLLGEPAEAPANEDTGEELTVDTFPDFGLQVFSARSSQMRLILRSGPGPDTPVLAGHAHADLLGIYLDIGNQPLIVPAGSYSYRADARRWPQGEPAWRQYFRGPAAANTACVDDLDPWGPVRGDFRAQTLPTRVATSCRSSHPALMVWQASLCDSPAGAVSRVVAWIDDDYVFIYDRPPEGATATTNRLQLAPGLRVTAHGQAVTVGTADGVALCRLQSLATAPIAVQEGDEGEPAGWCAPQYGKRVPAPQLTVRHDAAPGGWLIQHGSTPPGHAEVSAAPMGACIAVAGERYRDQLWLDHCDDSEVATDAEILWVRRAVDGTVIEIRAARISRLDVVGIGSVVLKAPELWLTLQFDGGNVKVVTASGALAQVH